VSGVQTAETEPSLTRDRLFPDEIPGLTSTAIVEDVGVVFECLRDCLEFGGIVPDGLAQVECGGVEFDAFFSGGGADAREKVAPADVGALS